MGPPLLLHMALASDSPKQDSVLFPDKKILLESGGSGKGNSRPGWWEIVGGGWLARPTLPQSAARRERITTARRSSVCHAQRAPSRREKGSSPATFALGVMPTGLLEPPTSPRVQVPGEQTIQSGVGWALGRPWHGISQGQAQAPCHSPSQHPVCVPLSPETG